MGAVADIEHGQRTFSNGHGCDDLLDRILAFIAVLTVEIDAELVVFAFARCSYAHSRDLDYTTMSAKLLILYATETGTAQDVADRIARECRRGSFQSRVCDVAAYPPASDSRIPGRISRSLSLGRLDI